jgi:hypothetical protein
MAFILKRSAFMIYGIQRFFQCNNFRGAFFILGVTDASPPRRYVGGVVI